MNIQKILNRINKVDSKNTIAPITIMFLVFYGGIAAPKLPSLVLKLFSLPIFRVLILSLIVYKGNSNPTLSIMVAVGFILVMDKIKKNETFNNTKKYIKRKKIYEKFSSDDKSPHFNCDNFLPMPGRTIMSVEPKVDGTCKIHYFSLPGEKIDCSICQNEPDPTKEVADCNLITNQGFCEYEYMEIYPDEVDPISEDQISEPINEDQILDELQDIFSELESMQSVNEKELDKINKIKVG